MNAPTPTSPHDLVLVDRSETQRFIESIANDLWDRLASLSCCPPLSAIDEPEALRIKRTATDYHWPLAELRAGLASADRDMQFARIQVAIARIVLQRAEARARDVDMAVSSWSYPVDAQTYRMGPIARLPGDVLRKVFMYHLLASGHNYRMFAVLLFVCKHWKTLLLSEGAFWSFIDLDRNENQIQALLRLSKEAPLTVTSSVQLGGSTNAPVFTQKTSEMLRSIRHRIKAFWLANPYHLALWTRKNPAPFPLLTDINISPSAGGSLSDRQSWDISVFLETIFAPQMRSAGLFGPLSLINTPFLPGIEAFSLEPINSNPRNALGMVISKPSIGRVLRYLSLHFSWFEATSELWRASVNEKSLLCLNTLILNVGSWLDNGKLASFNDLAISVPSLHELVMINMADHVVADFCKNIKAPNLRTLLWKSGEGGEEGVTAIGRMWPQLEKLYLDMYFDPDPGQTGMSLIKSLEQMTNLRVLAARFPWHFNRKILHRLTNPDPGEPVLCPQLHAVDLPSDKDTPVFLYSNLVHSRARDPATCPLEQIAVAKSIIGREDLSLIVKDLCTEIRWESLVEWRGGLDGRWSDRGL